MHKEMRALPGQFLEDWSVRDLVGSKALELPQRQATDDSMYEQGSERRWRVSPIVIDPPPKVETIGDFGQRQLGATSDAQFPAVSPSALKSMRAKIRELGIRRRTELSLAEIAYRLNPLLRGWINYYGRYAPSALAPLLRYVNQTLLAWALRKFKRFRAHKIRASQFLQKLSRQSAHLFVHWRLGMTGVFA